MSENGDNAGGSTGGDLDLITQGGKRLRTRLVFQSQIRAMERGQEIDVSEMDRCIQMAVSIRDNTELTPRERMRAVEFLDKLVERGVNVAAALSRSEQAVMPVQVNGNATFTVSFDRAG